MSESSMSCVAPEWRREWLKCLVLKKVDEAYECAETIAGEITTYLCTLPERNLKQQVLCSQLDSMAGCLRVMIVGYGNLCLQQQQLDQLDLLPLLLSTCCDVLSVRCKLVKVSPETASQFNNCDSLFRLMSYHLKDSPSKIIDTLLQCDLLNPKIADLLDMILRLFNSRMPQKSTNGDNKELIAKSIILLNKLHSQMGEENAPILSLAATIKRLSVSDEVLDIFSKALDKTVTVDQLLQPDAIGSETVQRILDDICSSDSNSFRLPLKSHSSSSVASSTCLVLEGMEEPVAQIPEISVVEIDQELSAFEEPKEPDIQMEDLSEIRKEAKVVSKKCRSQPVKLKEPDSVTSKKARTAPTGTDNVTPPLKMRLRSRNKK